MYFLQKPKNHLELCDYKINYVLIIYVTILIL